MTIQSIHKAIELFAQAADGTDLRRGADMSVVRCVCLAEKIIYLHKHVLGWEMGCLCQRAFRLSQLDLAPGSMGEVQRKHPVFVPYIK